jgi:predicted metal-dependent hydrolase
MKNGLAMAGELPVRLIDYIIVHELVHLQEPHHSPEFWQAIDRALPMWRQLRDALRSAGARFLVFSRDSLRPL